MKKPLLLTFLFVFHLICKAQTWTEYPAYGLAYNQINSTVIDTNGNKWFATPLGISKFDGTTWTKYVPSNTNGQLVTNQFQSIGIDSTGKIWAAYTQGLASFDGTNWTSYTNPYFPPHVAGVTLAIDGNGNKWIGCLEGIGIAKFDGTNWTLYSASATSNSLAYDDVLCITVDSKNNKWIGTLGGGICLFNDTNWTNYQYNGSGWAITTDNNNTQQGYANDHIIAIATDIRGNIWVSADDGDIFSSKISNITNLEQYASYPNSSPLSIAIDKTDTVWVLTNRGLSKFNGTSWTNYTYPTGGFDFDPFIPGDIALDTAGNVWIANANAEGAIVFNGTNWTTYTQANTAKYLANGPITAIEFDTQGAAWIGTNGGGLSKFDGTNWLTYTNVNTNNNFFNNVLALKINGEGNKWIGTESGLSKFDGTTWTNYTSQNTSNGTDSLLEGEVNSIAIDINGDVWVTQSERGICKFDGTTWKSYTQHNTNNGTDSLISNYINYIAIDKQGNKWVATSYGISKFDGTNWTSYTSHSTNNGTDSLISNIVNSIAIEPNGTIWFGTSGGASSFDGTNWKSYVIENPTNLLGVSSSAINTIAIDSVGNVWFGGIGASVFDGTNFTSYTQPNTNGGLASDNVGRIAIDPKGNVWFGTTEAGISVLSASSVTSISQPATSTANEVKAFPNPFGSVTTITFSNPRQEEYSLTITDLQGSRIKEYDHITSSKITISLTGVRAGVYIYQLLNKVKGKTWQGKLVVTGD